MSAAEKCHYLLLNGQMCDQDALWPEDAPILICAGHAAAACAGPLVAEIEAELTDEPPRP